MKEQNYFVVGERVAFYCDNKWIEITQDGPFYPHELINACLKLEAQSSIKVSDILDRTVRITLQDSLIRERIGVVLVKGWHLITDYSVSIEGFYNEVLEPLEVGIVP